MDTYRVTEAEYTNTAKAIGEFDTEAEALREAKRCIVIAHAIHGEAGYARHYAVVCPNGALIAVPHEETLGQAIAPKPRRAQPVKNHLEWF